MSAAFIYSDDGGSKGRRTRLFRDCANCLGVEWIYAVDWAAGHDRWFGFGMAENYSIRKMQKDGYVLTKWLPK